MVYGIIAVMFGVICMANAGLKSGGGFGLAAGIMGLAAGLAKAADDE